MRWFCRTVLCPLVRKLRLRRIGVTDPSRVDQVC
ncbi:hypothetical protein T4D_11182 [Trichinella pseudospiralis]|uniref:Uncharacterized protein n=1 Tax=Trichinella pseudospiralis TaxID=6337 RepID=A0A0V1F2K3_TRIPS|nr:hypothetical protein T4D_11182 [Trichinella pseudospiralis]